MDFKSPFTLQCVLVIITMIDGKCEQKCSFCSDTFVRSPLGYVCWLNQEMAVWDSALLMTLGMSFSSSSYIPPNDTYCNKSICLQNVAKKDKGKYEFELNHILMKSFLLQESTQIPAVHIRCLPGGGGELVCNALDNSSVKVDWSVDGHPLNPTEACITDNGKKIILEKRVTGELVCHTHHGNSTSKSSPIKLSCEEGDLLYQPLFHYILAACGGGAVVLAVIASLITCCCLKSKQQFIPVPSEEEKEEGMAMSVISKEDTKSPPNGDHHEMPSASEDSPPKPESAETCQGLEEEYKVEAESEVMPDPEVVVDINNEDILCNTFPDPIDP
uniref:Ig-like domain-containing protein n=1 Tax=Pelodiscus sinensis TaxID=13735 RepID=K7FSZ5_PELSI